MGSPLAPEVRSDLIQLFEADAPIPKILERAEQSIAAAIRGPIRAETLIRSALLQISMTPALQSCNKLSIVQAVMQSASLGLMVGGPAGEAALVPNKNKAQLIPMVRGLVTLAIRSGSVLAVSPVAVYKGETFKVYRGTRNEIIHEPSFDDEVDRQDDTNIVAVYAVFQMAGGVMHFDVMSRKEIERVRAVSKATSTDTPWFKWWGEKAKVTVVKRGSKMVPLSAEFNAAVELDNRLETGTINQPSELLDTAGDISDHVRHQTQARTDSLRDRMAADRPAIGAGAAEPVPTPAKADARPVASARYVTGSKKCRTCEALPGTPHKGKCPNA